MRNVEGLGAHNGRLSARWYAVHSQPHRERRAAAHLGLQGFRAFLPLHARTVRHARRFRTVLAPFFPRYLFVEMVLGRDRWRSVNGTVGVARLVMEGDQPMPVAPGVVEALLALADSSGLLSLERRLEPGQRVRIVTGPLAGLVGQLAALDERGRVKVLLDVLGTRVPVLTSGARLVPAA
ncbi:MAG: transcriptional activator RfaH [Bauldia sp.]